MTYIHTRTCNDLISIQWSVKSVLAKNSKVPSKIAAGPSGSQLDKLAGPTAILRASGPRARSILKPADKLS